MDSNEIFQDMTKGKVKELAAEDNVSVRYIYQMREGIAANILDRAEIYLNKSEDDAGIQWLCARQGGFFYKELEYDGQHDFSIINKVLNGFSDYFKTFSESLADGEVDIKEGAACREKWNKLKAVVEPFLQGAEDGKYIKK